MGSAMAANLVRKGFTVRTWDRDPEARARFAAENGVAETAAFTDLAAADIIVTMLPTGDVVNRVLTDGGAESLINTLRPGSIVIDTTSSVPDGTRALGAALAARGVSLIDAPVSGARKGALDGTLVFMIGGDDAAALDRATPVLSAMGTRLIRTGPLASGNAMKALNNYVSAAGFATACEALIVGREYGLDPAVMVDILNISTGRNFATKVSLPRIVDRNFVGTFSLGLFTKDIKIAADMAEAAASPPPSPTSSTPAWPRRWRRWAATAITPPPICTGKHRFPAMSDAPYQHIEVSVRDGVQHIVLNRPDKLNALGFGPGSSRDEIARAVIAADADDSVGCVLISATGRAFCAGGDLTRIAVRTGAHETPLEAYQFNDASRRFLETLRATHKPLIAAVHGMCLGAGLGFMAQCDIVIAADDARFGLIEGRIGHPGAAELVPLIGAAWTKFMILTGELITAERAAAIGMVLHVVPAAELPARATALAERIARMPREAVLLNKACVTSMSEAMGPATGRLVARAHESITRAMTYAAQAPDGRFFETILRDEGLAGLKAARDTQYSEPWLDDRLGKA